ncbi:MAG: uroporphyrinogen decarboxylase family protein [Phycisphaerae bacterium]
MNGYERILAQLDGRPTDCLPFMPITMMFAADRLGVKYGQYTQDHRVLVEAQCRVAEEFDFDYVSAISDPAREAGDCGAAVEFFEDQPPAIIEHQALLADSAKLASLKVPDPCAGGRMLDRVKAIELFKQRVGGQKLIEGWIEGPCAEGADLRGINALMLDVLDEPAFVRDLFDFCVELGLTFAKAQIAAGADLISIGDAAASLVGPQVYEELVWPAEKKLIAGLRALGTRVRLHICGNIRDLCQKVGELGCDIVDIDYPVPISKARTEMGPQQILLGNIEPAGVLRKGTPEDVFKAIEECHRQAGQRYIVSAGCEVCRDTPLENVRAMRDYARSHK